MSCVSTHSYLSLNTKEKCYYIFFKKILTLLLNFLAKHDWFPQIRKHVGKKKINVGNRNGIFLYKSSLLWIRLCNKHKITISTVDVHKKSQIKRLNFQVPIQIFVIYKHIIKFTKITIVGILAWTWAGALIQINRTHDAKYFLDIQIRGVCGLGW